MRTSRIEVPLLLGTSCDGLEWLTERIDEAWRVLSDPELRSGYDAALPAVGPEAEVPMPLEVALGFEPGGGVTPVPDLEPMDEDP